MDAQDRERVAAAKGSIPYRVTMIEHRVHRSLHRLTPGDPYGAFLVRLLARCYQIERDYRTANPPNYAGL